METLNLHINYACPLHCAYCVQREQPELINQYLTAEEMIEKVQNFLDYIKKPKCKVNISGGEPLLKYEDIQKLIKAFPQNSYEISTSGYLLTKEKAEFFSYYGVNYILSVDGGERVTKYLRPTENGKLNYFQKLKNNLPHVFYYAPYTRAKLIIPKKLISEIYNSYLELEQLGFQEIFITPNVYENEVDILNPELSTGNWTKEDWDAFQNQLFLIVQQIQYGIKINKKRCVITNIENIITKRLFPANNYQPNYVICEVLDYKSGASPTNGQIKTQELTPISLCMNNIDNNIQTQQQLRDKAQADFEHLPKKCPNDENCPYLNTCVYNVCLSENVKAHMSNIWIASPFQCKMQKIYHQLADNLMQTYEEYKNSSVMKNFYFRRIIEKRSSLI